MKAILEFNLNEPDDVKAHLRCVKATDMASVIFQLKNNFGRNMERYIESHENMNAYDTMEYILERLMETIDAEGIIIEDLID